MLTAGLLLPSSANASVPRATAAHSNAGLTITSVSNPHPDLVSGGQVLLRIAVPAQDHGALQVTLNGRAETGVFRAQTDGTWLGFVTDLRQGHNDVVARIGWDRAHLE